MLTIPLKEIVIASAANFCVSPESVRRAWGPSRAQRARHVAVYLARHHTRLSLPRLAKIFGGLHHTTILNGQRVIAAGVAENDKKVCQQVLAVEEILAMRRAMRERQRDSAHATSGGEG